MYYGAVPPANIGVLSVHREKERARSLCSPGISIGLVWHSQQGPPGTVSTKSYFCRWQLFSLCDPQEVFSSWISPRIAPPACLHRAGTDVGVHADCLDARTNGSRWAICYVPSAKENDLFHMNPWQQHRGDLKHSVTSEERKHNIKKVQCQNGTHTNDKFTNGLITTKYEWDVLVLNQSYCLFSSFSFHNSFLPSCSEYSSSVFMHCLCVSVGFGDFLLHGLKTVWHLVRMIPVSAARPSPHLPRASTTSHPSVLIIHNIIAPDGHAYLLSHHSAISQACIIVGPITAHICYIPPKDSNRPAVSVSPEPTFYSQGIRKDSEVRWPWSASHSNNKCSCDLLLSVNVFSVNAVVFSLNVLEVFFCCCWFLSCDLDFRATVLSSSITALTAISSCESFLQLCIDFAGSICWV